MSFNSYGIKSTHQYQFAHFSSPGVSYNRLVQASTRIMPER